MVDSRGALAQDGRRAERLELRVPTTATQLPAVRAMAGDLAIRMDYDLDAVEDLRLAVDEACATLAQIAAGDAPLTVIFETTRAGLHIEAWVPTAEGTEVPQRRLRLGDPRHAGRRRRRPAASTQAEVPARRRLGDARSASSRWTSTCPVSGRAEAGSDAGQNLSVAR